MQYKRCGTVRN